MTDLSNDIRAILARLAEAQQPREPWFEPTALRNIWTGQRFGMPLVLKRSRADREALVYRHLAKICTLPAPTLYHAAPDLHGDGAWLVLEPVTCTPPGLSPRAATHWWQNPARRDRAVVMIAMLHGQFWNQPERVAAYDWLARYEPEDWWTALEDLERTPPGWTPLSRNYLGQLASATEMLLAGPETLIHGSFHPDNVGWRDQTPVLLDWESVSWTTPFADLGRLFTRLDFAAQPPAPLTPVDWRRPLLETYCTTLEVIADVDLTPDALATDVRHAMLWEWAVDLWLQARDPVPGNRDRYEAVLLAAEQLVAEP